jgi:hypothetical protein
MAMMGKGVPWPDAAIATGEETVVPEPGAHTCTPAFEKNEQVEAVVLFR